MCRMVELSRFIDENAIRDNCTEVNLAGSAYIITELHFTQSLSPILFFILLVSPHFLLFASKTLTL